MQKNETIQSIVDRNMCIGCGFCAAVCPKACISMVWDATRKWQPVIDEDRCVQCGMCAGVCPNALDALESAGREAVERGADYGVTGSEKASFCITYDQRDKTRLKSASGGTSTALLKRLLESGAVDCVIAAKSVSGRIGAPILRR
ncbi:MAG: 4Fe-4S dicluster domain-containing protein [Spartobacteria bacterium]|nr:4Fe-4S dicluster domain-containing protein [Spartobacteria bacterium]